jgi:hypothetical protein
MYDSLDGVASNLAASAPTVSLLISRYDTFANHNTLQPLEIIQSALGTLYSIFSIAGAGIWEKVRVAIRLC